MRLSALLLTALMFSPALAQPGPCGGKGAGQGMRSLTAMPNLMRVVMTQGAELNLTEAQQATFAKHRATAMPQNQALSKALRAAKQTLKTMAYGDADKAALDTQSAEILRLTNALTESKITCRTTLKTTLTPEQWTKLVTLHKAMAPQGRGMGRGRGMGQGKGMGRGKGMGGGKGMGQGK